MNNSEKIDFISKLLEHKNVSTNEKERIFNLTKEEIKKIGENDDERIDEIVKRIEKLEKGYNNQTTNELDNLDNNNDMGNKAQSIYYKRPSPKDVAEFMRLFNQRDGLKYLTHDFDEEEVFEIEQFLKKAKDIFSKKGQQFSIPRNLWEILKQFAFKKNPDWTSYDANYENVKIAEGWSTNEWIKWSTENKLHPIRNDKYKKIINYFRQLTRIESPRLENLTDNVIEKVFGKENEYIIDRVDLSKADFYTHVPSFRRALISIFEEIKKRTENKKQRKISIKYERGVEDEYFLRKLIITHYNSFPTKELDVLCKEWQSSDDKGVMGGIKINIIGYCNWSVETIIEGKAVRINILRNENTPEKENINEASVVGFTHILTFYYK